MYDLNLDHLVSLFFGHDCAIYSNRFNFRRSFRDFIRPRSFLLFFVLLLFLGCSSPEDPVFEKESTSSGSSTSVVLGDNLTKGFMLDAENAFGTTVLCNGKSAKEFIPRVGETVNCLFNDLTLATFTVVKKNDPDQGLQLD